MGKDTTLLYGLVKDTGVRMIFELNRFNDGLSEAMPDHGLERQVATELGERLQAIKQAVADLVAFADGKLR